MSILIVDDSQIMRKIMAQAIKKVGNFDVVEAADGQEGVETLLKDSTIELVLMDWNMPVMTGIEALKKIRMNQKSIPVIMVTTEAEKERVLEAIKSGANDYLAKPFGPDDIKAKLKKFLLKV
ncbi:MAG: response regulator [Candidatus Zixiibacteriota bacterium]